MNDPYMKIRIQLQTLVGLLCACAVGWHYLRWQGVLIALAVYGLR
jgi:hypothetical protein